PSLLAHAAEPHACSLLCSECSCLHGHAACLTAALSPPSRRPLSQISITASPSLPFSLSPYLCPGPNPRRRPAPPGHVHLDLGVPTQKMVSRRRRAVRGPATADLGARQPRRRAARRRPSSARRPAPPGPMHLSLVAPTRKMAWSRRPVWHVACDGWPPALVRLRVWFRFLACCVAAISEDLKLLQLGRFYR
ncbi:unnamed protein product, partial [Urochloa humidicola]